LLSSGSGVGRRYVLPGPRIDALRERDRESEPCAYLRTGTVAPRRMSNRCVNGILLTMATIAAIGSSPSSCSVRERTGERTRCALDKCSEGYFCECSSIELAEALAGDESIDCGSARLFDSRSHLRVEECVRHALESDRPFRAQFGSELLAHDGYGLFGVEQRNRGSLYLRCLQTNPTEIDWECR
jgi:hypothetical protein